MTKFFLDEQVCPREELLYFLEHNGVQYVLEGEEIRFTLAQGHYKWLCVCRWGGNSVIIYSVYPFKLAEKDRAKAAEAINTVNGKLTRGGLFSHNGSPVMRTDADLFDAYGAYEAIARALEYNAGAMTEFWGQLAALAQSGGQKRFKAVRTAAAGAAGDSPVPTP